MYKDEKTRTKRAKFIQNAINDPKKAAEMLRLMALSLENCTRTNESVSCLSELLFLSEATIFRDLMK